MGAEMNKHVVTLNVNNWASPNAIASQRHAAERWGAEYHEFTQPWCTGTDASDVFAAKFDLGDLPFEQPCRVVWLDADVMVRADCPSLFDEVPAGTFGGVLNDQGYEGQDQCARDWWERTVDVLNVGVIIGADSYPVEYSQATYVNGGVLVFDLPTHEPIFATSKAKRIRADRTVNPMLEQTLLNIWLRLFADQTILAATYNRLGKEAWLSGPAMTSYVYHFANIGELRGDKRARMDRIDWRAA
jgi:hypothetical protein